MLLRPATPLAILFLIAFVLLLLATISTPIIKAIPLASYSGVDFGVFGYCQGDTCSGIRVGYSTDQLFNAQEEDDFSLPSSARHSLSSILIVHPVAALLTLICFLLAVAAHFHGPAHSPRYLLALLILTFPTLLVALLAFLVDILLFIPHMRWGGWIVLAATILIIASGVVTCAMRRTLVSRKARKKRIAENAEMNGQNYYANMQPPRMLADELPRADSPPPMSGANDTAKYASFETSTLERKSSDDRQPLNPRAPSVRSATSGHGSRQQTHPMNGAPPLPGQFMPMRDSPRDQYGNALPSQDEYGNTASPGDVAMANNLPPPGLRHHASRGSMGSNGSNRSQRSAGPAGPPPPGYRGRGGYTGPPRGRGGYGPPRGGFGPGGPRGGYGPGPGGRGGMPYRGRGGPQGMRGPPPPGWQGGPPPMGGRGMAAGPPPGVMAAGGIPLMGRGHQAPPPPGYGAPYAPGHDMAGPGLPPFTRNNGSPGPHVDEHGAIGQAIEMDERTGSPPVAAPMQSYGHDDESAPGMVGRQQDSRDITPVNQRQVSGNESRQVSGNAPPTPSSIYSQQTYIPARNNWAPPVPAHGHISPIDTSLPPANRSRDLSPVPASPSSRHHRVSSDHYYEDVDPRFASDPELPSPAISHAHEPRQSLLPNSLTPGSGTILRRPSPQHLAIDDGHSAGAASLERDSSYENIAEGARSPAGSDISHFTSVSQRGVNPNWRPGPPMGQAMTGSAFGGTGVATQKRNERDDMILGANPDFSIPGMGPPRGGFQQRGGRGGPTGLRPGPGPSGLTPQGRYPTDL